MGKITLIEGIILAFYGICTFGIIIAMIINVMEGSDNLEDDSKGVL